ncbi:MAG: acylneuraminate cytidylyltransferase family protein [Phycisphaerales bacterium]|nr:acylneuraminate cytidylyltransferase family protein [Phycisphaerales bacterium]
MRAAGALVVVLGRGGSKGLPGKNSRVLAGKPCAWWTIEMALRARCAGVVAISTDDAALKGIGKAAGARVVDRPEALAGDTATIDDAARHAVMALDHASCLEESDRARAVELDPVVILYANVPVRPEGLIDRAVELCESTGCDSVQSYAPVGKYHPWWMARIGEGGQVRPWEGDVLNHGAYRRQDLPPAHVPDGGIIVVRRRALFLKVEGAERGPHAFFGTDRRGIINPEGAVVDIDSEVDAMVAEAVLEKTGRGFRG